MNSFWIVVSEDRGPASYPVRHPTEDSAIKESVRLARQHGGTFFVMEAKAITRKTDITVKRIGDDFEIPF